jgi:hypothetical protein
MKVPHVKYFYFFYIIEGLNLKEKDYKTIKQGVLNPITSVENKFLILLGQVSKKIMLQSRIQLILANASAHLFALRYECNIFTSHRSSNNLLMFLTKTQSTTSHTIHDLYYKD